MITELQRKFLMWIACDVYGPVRLNSLDHSYCGIGKTDRHLFIHKKLKWFIESAVHGVDVNILYLFQVTDGLQRIDE